MFEYFEGNYTWNMAVNLALGMGASIGDIDDASRALRPIAKNNDDDAAERFFAAWTKIGDKERGLAQGDEAKGRLLSAGDKYRRAAIYFIQAERMQQPAFKARQQAYHDALACFSKFIALTGRRCERVEVPYENTTLPALFIPASGQKPGQKSPCVVHFDGLDVLKEIITLMGMPEALAARGVATLVVDHPGVGEALRRKGLTNFPETEKPAAACVDYLERRGDVDPNRIGMVALSLGGYMAPRAAAFETRFRCCVAWGANYDWGAIQRMRAADPNSSLPVPHYWDHVGWVFGKKSVDEIMDMSYRLTLKGILDRIRCPILVTHGENDRQIGLDFARQTIAECVNSPKAELHVHTLAEGGAEHCSVDNVPLGRDVIADWVAEVLGGDPAGVR